jgi:hypothetical protein
LNKNQEERMKYLFNPLKESLEVASLLKHLLYSRLMQPCNLPKAVAIVLHTAEASTPGETAIPAEVVAEEGFARGGGSRRF